MDKKNEFPAVDAMAAYRKLGEVSKRTDYKLDELMNTIDLNPWDSPTGSRTQMFRTYQPSLRCRIRQMSAREFLDFTSDPVSRLTKVPEVIDHAFGMTFKKPIKFSYPGYQLIKDSANRS